MSLDKEWWERYLNSEFYEPDEPTTVTSEPQNQPKQPTIKIKQLQQLPQQHTIEKVSGIQKPKKDAINVDFTEPKLYNLSFDLIDCTKNKKKKKQTKVEQQDDIIPITTINNGPWSREEFESFVQGYQTLGKRWKQIATHFVKTRNAVQVTSYGQKYLKEKKQNQNKLL